MASSGTTHTYKVSYKLTDGTSADAGDIVVVDGLDGTNGTDGTDGKDGVGLESITVTEVTS